MKIRIDATPRYEVSPYLFMQFMEPLGTTDASVEAGWDFTRNCWRPELLEVVRDLSPSMIRWGGILTSFWKWIEGIGPREQRIPMVNYIWGGLESNQVGLHEFMDFCSQVGAEPLIGVNFAADGRPEYINTSLGEERAGTPEEAAELVRYCNDPDHKERQGNGRAEPWELDIWQIGNETSYPPSGERFSSEESARQYVEFAKAMRAADPSIKLIGWGCREKNGHWWAEELLDIAGDQVDLVATHMMHQSPQRPDTILVGMKYMQDRDRAWAELLEIYDTLEPRLLELKEIIHTAGSTAKIAITEGHLSLQPHNGNFILHEWLSGLYHAKVMNLYQRYGDMVKIATLADFCGNRWTVNAVMVGSPRQQPYLMPAGVIGRLYRHHIGELGIEVPAGIGTLDLAASRTGDRLFLHVVNEDLHSSQSLNIEVEGFEIAEGRAFEIAPESLSAYVHFDNPTALDPIERKVRAGKSVQWRFPPASVTVLELDLCNQE